MTDVSPEQPQPNQNSPQPQPVPNPSSPGTSGAPQSGQITSAPSVTGIQLSGILQQSLHWQGPYPSPDAVERYERVQPGTFDRLIKMAEQLQAAQIQQSATALD